MFGNKFIDILYKILTFYRKPKIIETDLGKFAAEERWIRVCGNWQKTIVYKEVNVDDKSAR